MGCEALDDEGTTRRNGSAPEQARGGKVNNIARRP